MEIITEINDNFRVSSYLRAIAGIYCITKKTMAYLATMINWKKTILVIIYLTNAVLW